jgi:hypothetical protein
MRGYILAQSGKSKIRPVINETAIFKTHGDVLDQFVIHAPAINKRWAGLPLRPTNEPSRVADRIKHERARASLLSNSGSFAN